LPLSISCCCVRSLNQTLMPHTFVSL
jgi:hypothetical protein